MKLSQLLLILTLQTFSFSGLVHAIAITPTQLPRKLDSGFEFNVENATIVQSNPPNVPLDQVDAAVFNFMVYGCIDKDFEGDCAYFKWSSLGDGDCSNVLKGTKYNDELTSVTPGFRGTKCVFYQHPNCRGRSTFDLPFGWGIFNFKDFPQFDLNDRLARFSMSQYYTWPPRSDRAIRVL
ncbi:hypothetical protein BJ508DRAFT_300647 [Ascobolus immersus RN42]|uniref:Uncharacterized protein n=1 Tax=Ascobolus immersus RN42 TaxID=1160509 RepID=A0A3N4IVN3_ASCIM|nr:hypothetical protein BJ508DRAFT_300647 [Ascobolus immersus RN42]